MLDDNVWPLLLAEIASNHHKTKRKIQHYLFMCDAHILMSIFNLCNIRKYLIIIIIIIIIVIIIIFFKLAFITKKFFVPACRIY